VEEVARMVGMKEFIWNFSLDDDERAIQKCVFQKYYVGLLTGIIRLLTGSMGAL
jgi:hypothetical protein